MKKSLLNFIIVLTITIIMAACMPGGLPEPEVEPPVPTGLAISSATATTITLTWNSVEDADGYRIYRSSSAFGTYTQVSGDITSGLTYTDTGLTEGTTYYYKVTAYNDVGESAQSLSVSGIPGSAPSTPTGLTVSSATDTTITLTWNTVTGAVGYKIYKSTTETGTYTQTGVNVTVGVTFTDTGLTAGTTYYYKISAYNNSGESSQSTAISGSPGTAPATPTGLTATTITLTSITVSWTAVSDATGYRVYRNSALSGTYTQLGSDITSGTEYTDTGLTEGTNYYYKVSAYNSSGESTQSSALSTATGSLPTTPANFDVELTTANSVDLTWDTVSNADGYRIYRSTTVDGTFTQTGSDVSGDESFSDTGLSSGSLYFYKILAFNEYGSSDQSAAISALVLSFTDLTVDLSANTTGLYTSLAVDTSDKIHISYYDATYQDVKYATDKNGAWYSTYAASILEVGRYSSIAVDVSGDVHIVYNRNISFGDGDDVFYSTNYGGGQWSSTIIAETGDLGLSTSIAIDGNRKLHVSYGRDDNDDLVYATNTSGSWVTETVDADDLTGNNSSIAVDSNGKVHISYYNFTPDNALKYATNASGSWVTTTVDDTDYAGWHTAITVDSSDKVHISYYVRYEALKYATNASGSWVDETVDTDGDVGDYNDIAVDSGDRVHISYYDNTGKDLKYATKPADDWIILVVDSEGDVGSYSSIDLDSSDNIHMSYYDATNTTMMYASSNAGLTTDTGSVPDTPANPVATGSTSTTIDFGWDAVTGAVGYKIYAKNSDTGLFDYLAATTGTSTTLTGLTSSTSYYLKVTAYNTYGESYKSAQETYATSAP